MCVKREPENWAAQRVSGAVQERIGNWTGEGMPGLSSEGLQLGGSSRVINRGAKAASRALTCSSGVVSEEHAIVSAIRCQQQAHQ